MHTRFDTESRIAVTQAADIARELGHREVGPGHLLVGLLANPRGTAYAALWEHGVNRDTARDLVAAHHVDAEPRPGATDETTLTRGYEEDRAALQAIGIDLDRVREAVRDNLGADLTEGWGERSGRERGRAHRHEHGQGRGGRGRRGPRSRREGPRFSVELRAVLRDVRRSVVRDRLEVDDRDQARRIPGMTGARLLLALTRSDDAAVQAVLATSTGIDGLRAQAEAGTRPATEV